MKSERQKSLRKKAIIFGIISYGLLFTLLLVYLISGLSNLDALKNGVEVFSEETKRIIISASITAVIGTIMTIFLKEGMRTFIWIVCVVLGSLVYKEAGMYIALGCWLIDDYVIHKLYKYYKEKLIVRKEIDYDLKEEESGESKEE